MSNMMYNPKGFLLNGGILEYRALGETGPVDFIKTGLVLSITEPVWLFPFKKKRVPVNIKPVIPNKTIGLITPSEYIDNDLEVYVKIIDETFDCLDNPLMVTVRSTRLLPRKIKQKTKIALLTIIPYVELQYIANNNID